MSHRRAPARPRGSRRGTRAALASAVLASLLLAPGGALAADGDVTISVVSDTTWVVDDADAGVGPSLSLPGTAQRVCLNDAAPAGCPADAKGFVSRGFQNFRLEYIEGGILSAKAQATDGKELQIRMFPEF